MELHFCTRFYTPSLVECHTLLSYPHSWIPGTSPSKTKPFASLQTSCHHWAQKSFYTTL